MPGGGEVVLEPPIAEAYTKAGGEAKLGAPSGQPEKVGDGTVQAFAKGTIFSSPSTGAHLVQGEILKVYTAQGGAGGALGFPTADEEETAGGPDVAKGGWIGEFQKGTITWLNQGDGTFKGNRHPEVAIGCGGRCTVSACRATTAGSPRETNPAMSDRARVVDG